MKLALMTKDDNAFNGRDFVAVDAVHHPDMVAYITGLAEPVYGRKAHAAATQQILQVLPEMHVNTLHPIQFGGGDWVTRYLVCQASMRISRPECGPNFATGGKHFGKHHSSNGSVFQGRSSVAILDGLLSGQ